MAAQWWNESIEEEERHQWGCDEGTQERYIHFAFVSTILRMRSNHMALEAACNNEYCIWACVRLHATAISSTTHDPGLTVLLDTNDLKQIYLKCSCNIPIVHSQMMSNCFQVTQLSLNISNDMPMRYAHCLFFLPQIPMSFPHDHLECFQKHHRIISSWPWLTDTH